MKNSTGLTLCFFFSGVTVMMGGEQSHTRKDGEGAEGAGKAEESTNTDSPGSAASEG